MLPPRLFPLVVISFVFAADADAQMCESSLQPTGSTSLVLGVERSIRAPTLGVRRFGSRVWGGAFVGRTSTDLERLTFGQDDVGDYIGVDYLATVPTHLRSAAQATVFTEAYRLVTRNWAAIETLAGALLEGETLTGVEVRRLVKLAEELEG